MRKDGRFPLWRIAYNLCTAPIVFPLFYLGKFLIFLSVLINGGYKEARDCNSYIR